MGLVEVERNFDVEGEVCWRGEYGRFGCGARLFGVARPSGVAGLVVGVEGRVINRGASAGGGAGAGGAWMAEGGA